MLLRRSLLLLAVLTLPRLGSGAPRRTISVAVAANMRPAFEEIAARFRIAHPDVDVKATYGASANFFAQLSNGAPFDLFLSADAEFPARVVEKGLAQGEAFTYAYGKLVVWVPNGSGLDFARKGLAALLDPSVRRIAIANPELAPYGRAAMQALENARVLPQLKARIVIGQNVAQAAQFVQSGNAQAGFVALSLARAAPLSEQGRAWAVPPRSYERVEQAGVLIKGARDGALARELVTFIRAGDGRGILERYGYELPAS